MFILLNRHGLLQHNYSHNFTTDIIVIQALLFLVLANEHCRVIFSPLHPLNQRVKIKNGQQTLMQNHVNFILQNYDHHSMTAKAGVWYFPAPTPTLSFTHDTPLTAWLLRGSRRVGGWLKLNNLSVSHLFLLYRNSVRLGGKGGSCRPSYCVSVIKTKLFI